MADDFHSGGHSFAGAAFAHAGTFSRGATYTAGRVNGSNAYRGYFNGAPAAFMLGVATSTPEAASTAVETGTAATIGIATSIAAMPAVGVDGAMAHGMADMAAGADTRPGTAVGIGVGAIPTRTSLYDYYPSGDYYYNYYPGTSYYSYGSYPPSGYYYGDAGAYPATAYTDAYYDNYPPDNSTVLESAPGSGAGENPSPPVNESPATDNQHGSDQRWNIIPKPRGISGRRLSKRLAICRAGGSGRSREPSRSRSCFRSRCSPKATTRPRPARRMPPWRWVRWLSGKTSMPTTTMSPSTRPVAAHQSAAAADPNSAADHFLLAYHYVMMERTIGQSPSSPRWCSLRRTIAGPALLDSTRADEPLDPAGERAPPQGAAL